MMAVNRFLSKHDLLIALQYPNVMRCGQFGNLGQDLSLAVVFHMCRQDGWPGREGNDPAPELATVKAKHQQKTADTSRAPWHRMVERPR